MIMRIAESINLSVEDNGSILYMLGYQVLIPSRWLFILLLC